jgi:hypothetical protein
MDKPPFSIARLDQRLEIKLSGVIDAAVCADLRREAEKVLATQKFGGMELWTDLRDVTDYRENARAGLLAFHTMCARKVRRSAYISGSAHVRGLALWVVHIADDENAKVVMTAAQGEEWLRGSEGRVNSVRRQTMELVDITDRLVYSIRQRAGGFQ